MAANRNKARGSGDTVVDANATGDMDSTDTQGLMGAAGGRGEAGRGRGTEVVMTGRQFDADCYNMNHKNRGNAIIFNNKTFDPATGKGERNGTGVDAEKMYMMLSEMGFSVEVKPDYTASKIESALVQAAREDHSEADCFACVILSHGEEGYIYGKDKPIEINRLVAPFKGDRCKTLAGKPKIFFIQACRGEKLDGGVDVADTIGSRKEEDMEIEAVEIRRIPTEADFLMAYSVVPGFYAWRNSSDGSWFVQALVKVLRDNWRRMDLMSMMTRVCKIVAYEFESNASREFMKRKKQIPCITSMLTRDVYFSVK
ncbi:hypothetical protein ACOMHN_058592 [Nucella lapillus]